MQEASPSVVFIKDLVVGRTPGRGGGQAVEAEDGEEGGATVEGTGSGFVWDTAGHIVSKHRPSPFHPQKDIIILF